MLFSICRLTANLIPTATQIILTMLQPLCQSLPMSVTLMQLCQFLCSIALPDPRRADRKIDRNF